MDLRNRKKIGERIEVIIENQLEIFNHDHLGKIFS